MKQKHFTLLLMILLLGTQLGYAVVRPVAPAPDAPATEQVLTAGEARRAERAQERREHLEKRLERWESKLAKKMEKNKNKSALSLWDNSRFRIGVILVLAAIVLALLGAIIGSGGVLGFLGGLVGIAGIVFIVWGLIEYYE